MSVNQQELHNRVERARTDEALQVGEPLQNPRVSARIVPFVIALLVGIALIAAIFLFPQFS